MTLKHGYLVRKWMLTALHTSVVQARTDALIEKMSVRDERNNLEEKTSSSARYLSHKLAYVSAEGGVAKSALNLHEAPDREFSVCDSVPRSDDHCKISYHLAT